MMRPCNLSFASSKVGCSAAASFGERLRSVGGCPDCGGFAPFSSVARPFCFPDLSNRKLMDLSPCRVGYLTSVFTLVTAFGRCYLHASLPRVPLRHTSTRRRRGGAIAKSRRRLPRRQIPCVLWPLNCSTPWARPY